MVQFYNPPNTKHNYMVVWKSNKQIQPELYCNLRLTSPTMLEQNWREAAWSPGRTPKPEGAELCLPSDFVSGKKTDLCT